MALKYDVHAAGSAYSFQKFVLGKFPMSVPELRKEAGGKWRMRQDTADGGAEWELQEGSLEGEQGPKFRGVPDAGLAGTAAPSNYFLLVKEKGSDVFTAVPVSEWVTFKPVGRRGPQSLEQAEEQMKFQRVQVARVNPRLAQVARADEPAAPGGGGGAGREGDEEADSDEEWKDIKARARGRTALASSTPAAARRRAGDDEEGASPAGGGEASAPRPRDAEDWEHEEAAADDDLEMGSSGEEEAEPSPGARPAPSDSDGDDDLDPSRAKKALQQMLRQQVGDEGGRDSGAPSEAGSEGPDEDEDEEDEDEDQDLDAMAAEVLPGRAPSPPAGAGARKRKSPTPEALEEGPPAEEEAKRPRVAAPSPPAAAAPGGMPTAGEVVALLREHGRLPLSAIVAAFKDRMNTAEERKAFTQVIRGVAALEKPPSADGKKYLVLKE